MDEQERYSQICQPQFAEIIGKLDDLNHRLFVDNGNKSLVSRIAATETWATAIKWFTITTASGFILMFIGVIGWVIQNRISP